VSNRWPFTALTAVTLAWRWIALLFEANTVDIGAMVITAVWLTFAVGIIVESAKLRSRSSPVLATPTATAKDRVCSA